MSSIVSESDVQTFRAPNMHEALQLVRQKLGPDAAVLNARQVQQTRFFGLLRGETMVEVTASNKVNIPSRLKKSAPCPANTANSVSAGQARLHDAVLVSAGLNDARLSANEFGISSEKSSWDNVIHSFHQRQTMGTGQWSTSLFKAYNELLDADMSESIARELICAVAPQLKGEQTNDPATIQNCLLSEIAKRIPVSGVIRPQHRGYIVALVGPTGVGKTTTIAKLAAHYSLKEHIHVGLITVDTYRIAAVEQLRAYANIIDLPMLAVRSTQEMAQAVSRMRNLDLILMDTAGRGTREGDKILELKSYLDIAQADEVHLTLSGSCATRALCKSAETFAQTGLTSLILTKLDEAVGLGNLLPLIRSCRLPISYITNGQSVPEDFEEANPVSLAKMALGKSIV